MIRKIVYAALNALYSGNDVEEALRYCIGERAMLETKVKYGLCLKQEEYKMLDEIIEENSTREDEMMVSL